MDKRRDVGFVGNSFRTVGAFGVFASNMGIYNFEVINEVGVSKLDFLAIFILPAIATLLAQVSYKIFTVELWVKYVEPGLFGLVWGILLSYSIISMMIGYSWYFDGNGDKLEPLFISIAMGGGVAEISRRRLNSLYQQSVSAFSKDQAASL